MRAQTCGSRALIDSRKNILEIGGRVVQGWEHKKGRHEFRFTFTVFGKEGSCITLSK